ncbi:MAG: hypothetical protein M1817_005088 [Caeruleum heppii]|nr:MAG: hypothetical protein M1817_005088 [Caeruleum heppii]
MRSSFAARRKPRRIGQEDDEPVDISSGTSGTESGSEPDPSSVVRRPSVLPTAEASKPKKKSALRLSFGPGEVAAAETTEESSQLFTPKKSNLSRQAIEKNATRKSLGQAIAGESLPQRFRDPEDRPTYSKDYLEELKSSTPTTPREQSSEAEGAQALDVFSKFGVVESDAAIPSQAEIAEKKQRRARLAKERQFISLDDADEEESDDSNGDRELSRLEPKPKWEEGRLVREDEDIAEGFDDFVEDGRIVLGKKAERERSRRHKAEMRELIQEAEGEHSGDEDTSDDSEAERNAAYEAAQTKAGTYGTDARKEQQSHRTRPKAPQKITPLPSLPAVLARLEMQLDKVTVAQQQRRHNLEELRREKIDIINRKAEIQILLGEAGDKYAKIRADAAMPADTSFTANGSPPVNGLGSQAEGMMLVNRGLESFGQQNGTSHDEG